MCMLLRVTVCVCTWWECISECVRCWESLGWGRHRHVGTEAGVGMARDRTGQRTLTTASCPVGAGRGESTGNALAQFRRPCVDRPDGKEAGTDSRGNPTLVKMVKPPDEL